MQIKHSIQKGTLMIRFTKVMTAVVFLISFAAGSHAAASSGLSEAQVEAYLSGEGMGLAQAAEVNNYPGPRHVISFAKNLDLTTSQVSRIEGVQETMLAEATRLGASIVEKEKALDELFASGTADETNVKKATEEIAVLQGQLRAAHLSAHIAVRKLLLREQITKYDELRGNRQAAKFGYPRKKN